MFIFNAILYVRTRTRVWLKQGVGLCTHQQYCNWTVRDLHALRHMDHYSHCCKFTKHYRHFLKWLIKTFSKWRHDVSWILGVCFNAQCLLSVLWAVGWSSVGHFAVLCHLDDCNHVPGYPSQVEWRIGAFSLLACWFSVDIILYHLQGKKYNTWTQCYITSHWKSSSVFGCEPVFTCCFSNLG